MTMDSALKMAEVESKAGVSSTYFLLLRSSMYNLFAKDTSEKVRKIISLGHRIGLHFDPSLYSYSTTSDLNTFCSDECFLLESFFNISVDIVSFHRPEPNFLGFDGRIGGRIHTYHPSYFNDIVYCSDSRGEWRYGHPLDVIESSNLLAIQLLVHPIWWDSSKNENSIERLDRLVLEHNYSYQLELSRNCQVFKTN